MKKNNLIKTLLKVSVAAMLLSVVSLFIMSFTVSEKITQDFLKQLGISKTDADRKITDGFLGGYLDAYGASNAKNIALGNRTAVTKDLMNYAKAYVNSAAYIKEYAALKESKKPEKYQMKTPEELQQKMIADSKKAVADNEVSLKKADPQFKKIFEDVLIQAKKMLKEAEDPNNKSLASYRKNYENAVKQNEENYKRQLAGWEAEFPANHMLFVKKRLETFLDLTRNIDYTAELTSQNGFRVFVKKAYEDKSKQWKMAFRAGKEVVEPAREFVQNWVQEIK